ncbi:MAG: SO_0444 family Cu/Zn efflux transporter [Desulfomonilaceae bacterium]|nr:SO_0444 family Cu/Zn efflux transporter [Desulfomonilaceae bacterium]
MPAVTGLKKQGANNGACLSFLISTPESGVDSIALTYSLLDPIMTVIRPITGFVTALSAGITQNFVSKAPDDPQDGVPDRTCPVDGCCDGVDCDPAEHRRHHSFGEKLRAGSRFAMNELLEDLATWFLIGVILAGTISALVPDWFIAHSLGSGFLAYLAMLVAGLPMYVCATMSTPIAAALIVKGLSPGAALVFLVAGPATNVATITMVGGLLGRRTLGIYLASIVICTLLMAFVTDAVYTAAGVSAGAQVGAASGELVPYWLEIAAAGVLALLIARVYWNGIRRRLSESVQKQDSDDGLESASACGCGHEPPGDG